MEISLTELVKAWLKKIWIIIISILICGISFTLYAKFGITKTYTSSTQFMVMEVTKIESVDGIITSEYKQNNALTENIVFILDKSNFKDSFSESIESEGNYKGKWDLKLTTDTKHSAFTISFTTPDPEYSYFLVKNVSDYAKNYVKSMLSLNNKEIELRVIEDPVKAKNPSYPSVFKFALIGGLLGLLIPSVIVFLVFIYDNKIRDTETFALKYENIPIIGYIPKIEDEN